MKQDSRYSLRNMLVQSRVSLVGQIRNVVQIGREQELKSRPDRSSRPQ